MADYTITSSNVVPGSNASYGEGVAGEAINAGDAVAIETDSGDAAHNRIVQAEVSDESRSVVVGIAVSTAEAAGQLVKFAKPGSDVDMGSVFAAGDISILSDAGAIAPAADKATSDWVTVVGVALDADTLRIVGASPGVQSA